MSFNKSGIFYLVHSQCVSSIHAHGLINAISLAVDVSCLSVEVPLCVSAADFLFQWPLKNVFSANICQCPLCLLSTEDHSQHLS